MAKVIGRISKLNGSTGEAEFTQYAREGDYLYYNTEKGRVTVQLTTLRARPIKGYYGSFRIMESGAMLPKLWDFLYMIEQESPGYINIGETAKGEPYKVGVNPFFMHLLAGGMNRRGKTHLLIILWEEFVKNNIPAIAVDTQGELVNIAGAHVAEDIRFEDLLGILRQKKVFVYNLQGLSYKAKAERCNELLSQLFEAKERDYKRAEGDIKLLEIPPVIVGIDEAEVYAPTSNKQCNSIECRNSIINIAKRGGKIGIGLIPCSQRLPGLHYDVRSQCHSVAVFQIVDAGSHTVLAKYPYISKHEIQQIRNLKKGQCLMVGEISVPPTVVYTRDIHTKRAKDLNFEKLLGISKEATKSQPTPTEIPKELSFFNELRQEFPVRIISPHGDCLIIPESRFKKDWKQILANEGHKVLHVPNMGGGPSYLVACKGSTLDKLKKMAAKHLPRDESRCRY